MSALRQALEIIAQRDCDKFKGASNCGDQGLEVGSKWMANRVCDPCVARSALAAPLPEVGALPELPEGCPETAFFDPMDSQIHSDEKSGEEIPVEIMPDGSRALLEQLKEKTR